MLKLTILNPNRSAVILAALDDGESDLLEILALDSGALAQTLFCLLEDLAVFQGKDERDGVVLARLLLEVEAPKRAVTFVGLHLLFLFGNPLGVDGEELIERDNGMRQW